MKGSEEKMDPLEPNVTFTWLQRSPSSTQADSRQWGGTAGGEEEMNNGESKTFGPLGQKYHSIEKLVEHKRGVQMLKIP